MNKLYLLLLLMCIFVSCLSEDDFQLEKDNDILKQDSVPDFQRINFTSTKLRQQSPCISEPVFFTAEFDQESCEKSKGSSQDIHVYFSDRHLYFVSKRQMETAYMLEYVDIDDFHARIEEPASWFGRTQDYAVLKVPIRSNIECIHQLNIILLFAQHCTIKRIEMP